MRDPLKKIISSFRNCRTRQSTLSHAKMKLNERTKERFERASSTSTLDARCVFTDLVTLEHQRGIPTRGYYARDKRQRAHARAKVNACEGCVQHAHVASRSSPPSMRHWAKATVDRTLANGHLCAHWRALCAHALRRGTSAECVHAARREHRIAWRKTHAAQPVSPRRWIHSYGWCSGSHVFVVERVTESANVSLRRRFLSPGKSRDWFLRVLMDEWTGWNLSDYMVHVVFYYCDFSKCWLLHWNRNILESRDRLLWISIDEWMVWDLSHFSVQIASYYYDFWSVDWNILTFLIRTIHLTFSHFSGYVKIFEYCLLFK